MASNNIDTATLERIKKHFLKDQLGRELDIELVEIGPGYATTRMTVQPKHYNSLNIVHGGALFTLADIAFAAASNAYGTAAVAINVHMAYMRATEKGTLTAVAREVGRSRRLGTYTVDISDEHGQIVATFQGTAFRKEQPLPLAD